LILRELRLDNLRNLHALRLSPGAGLNVLVGANGAGKTSILEGVYLLSHGRSFRTRLNDILLSEGADRLDVFGMIESAGRMSRVGLSWDGARWSGRVDGEDGSSLTSVLRRCAAVCFEPGSHALISGPSEGRRRLVDWGVFHVEPSFPQVAARYRRALRQRNAALRDRAGDAVLSAWEDELAAAAAPLDAMRQRYLGSFIPRLVALLSAFLPGLGPGTIRVRRGWPVDQPLRQVLSESRGVDRERGHTTRGPHRADWQMSFPGATRREQLSRGQEKLCAIACVLAQAQSLRADRGEWPIIVLDDLASELDDNHQGLALAALDQEAQVFISGTGVPVSLQARRAAFSAFHVEHGQVRALL
jgi:DNA replication and repair protein RecF